MEVKKGKNKFYVGSSEDAPLAQMTYFMSENNSMVIDHTYVAEELNGQGVGKLLLKELVDWARSENLKIVPQCTYAKAQMEKNQEYHDMIFQ